MKLSTHPAPRSRLRGRSPLVLAALLAVAAGVQVLSPASASAMDDNGPRCTLGWLPGGVPALLDANGNLCEVSGGGDGTPGDGIPSEVIHVESTGPRPPLAETRPAAERFPSPREGCPGFGCTKGGQRLDRDNLLGHPGERKAGGAAKKEKVARKGEEKSIWDECITLLDDGHPLATPEERRKIAQSLETQIKNLKERNWGLHLYADGSPVPHWGTRRMRAVGNDQTWKMLQQMRDDARKPLVNELAALEAELAKLEPSRDRYLAAGCDAILKEREKGKKAGKVREV